MTRFIIVSIITILMSIATDSSMTQQSAGVMGDSVSGSVEVAAQQPAQNQRSRRFGGFGRGNQPFQPRNPQYVETESGERRLVHDINTPAPPVITPGVNNSPPSDAIVLFDGKDLSNWTSQNGGQPRWALRDGYMETVRSAGSLKTKQSYGSCQLHIEFATPEVVSGSSQGRGNSGIFLMDMYEVQVLDSYENATYPDGQCGALYGRAIPLVNASRKPGEWQSFDIIFHRPIFEGNEVVRKATFTILHNGVLIQDHVVLDGGTGWIDDHRVTEYQPHEDKRPLSLQDHDNPVKFRNIWVRELDD
jgi:hypothetical protein